LFALGSDVLTFLAATVVVVPLAKKFNFSPILGFLFTGFALDQAGLLGNEGSLSTLSELGVLFLLFEMGLELNTDRLKALAKYAFVLGGLQLLVSTACFTAIELPEGNALGSNFLETFLGAPEGLVTIRSSTEAIVIGAGLSLSSSAFVLQLLSDKGQLSTRYGSATLGILLMQDIAVVPLLVLLPLLGSQSGDGTATSMLMEIAPTLGTALLGVTALFLVGKVALSWVFDLVMSTRSHDAFVALCLLTVCGTSVVTTSIGLSDTLGAFLAGVLLAETNFRSQVEADMRPFRSLLLALFFLCTGTEINLQILIASWPSVLGLTAGLIAIKASVIIALGPIVGLTRAESVRTGFVLSQGGEFAFVVFTLANSLSILPEDLNQLLIVVVILSMALTPALAELGDWGGNQVDKWEKEKADLSGEVQSSDGFVDPAAEIAALVDPVVILGFNQYGQVLANMLTAPTIGNILPNKRSFVAFDLEPSRVKAARECNLNVYYGDGSNMALLHAAGITKPSTVCVCYTNRHRTKRAVQHLRAEFGEGVRIFARARDLQHAVELEEVGANFVSSEASVNSLRLGSEVLKGLGADISSVMLTSGILEESMMARARTNDLGYGSSASTSKKGPKSAESLEFAGQQRTTFALDTAVEAGAVGPTVIEPDYIFEASALALVKELNEVDAMDGKIEETSPPPLSSASAWQREGVEVTQEFEFNKVQLEMRPECADEDMYSECTPDPERSGDFSDPERRGDPQQRQ